MRLWHSRSHAFPCPTQRAAELAAAAAATEASKAADAAAEQRLAQLRGGERRRPPRTSAELHGEASSGDALELAGRSAPAADALRQHVEANDWIAAARVAVAMAIQNSLEEASSPLAAGADSSRSGRESSQPRGPTNSAAASYLAQELWDTSWERRLQLTSSGTSPRAERRPFAVAEPRWERRWGGVGAQGTCDGSYGDGRYGDGDDGYDGSNGRCCGSGADVYHDRQRHGGHGSANGSKGSECGGARRHVDRRMSTTGRGPDIGDRRIPGLLGGDDSPRVVAKGEPLPITKELLLAHDGCGEAKGPSSCEEDRCRSSEASVRQVAPTLVPSERPRHLASYESWPSACDPGNERPRGQAFGESGALAEAPAEALTDELGYLDGRAERPQLTARGLRARMVARPAADPAVDSFATLVDKAESKMAVAAALNDPNSGSGPLSFIGQAQAAASRRAAKSAEARRLEAQQRKRAGHDKPPSPVRIQVVDPVLSRANLRKIEMEEKKLFRRAEARRAREEAAAASGVPPVERRIARLVSELAEPLQPVRDFDREISQMLVAIPGRAAAGSAAAHKTSHQS